MKLIKSAYSILASKFKSEALNDVSNCSWINILPNTEVDSAKSVWQIDSMVNLSLHYSEIRASIANIIGWQIPVIIGKRRRSFRQKLLRLFGTTKSYPRIISN